MPGAYSDEIRREYEREQNEDAADWCEACGGPFLELNRIEGGEFCPDCRPKALEAVRSCPACQEDPAPGHSCGIYDDRGNSIALEELRKQREERRKRKYGR